MLCLVSNVMRLDYVGSSPLVNDNSLFCCVGNVCNTSKADIAHESLARFSTME